jgi:hypothetical protein
MATTDTAQAEHMRGRKGAKPREECRTMARRKRTRAARVGRKGDGEEEEGRKEGKKERKE